MSNNSFWIYAGSVMAVLGIVIAAVGGWPGSRSRKLCRRLPVGQTVARHEMMGDTAFAQVLTVITKTVPIDASSRTARMAWLQTDPFFVLAVTYIK